MNIKRIPFIITGLLSLIYHTHGLAQQPSSTQCASHIKASILLPQAQMQDRSQLRYGQLGHFEQHFSNRLTQVLNRNLQSAFVLAFSNERLDFSPSLSPTQSTRIPDWLNKITNSQYLLIPSIENMATEKERYIFGLWETSPERQFVLNLRLYHGVSGQLIWQKRYDSSAEWEFSLTTHVDSASQDFWQSDYGQNIDILLSQISQDLDVTLQCRPVIGQIIARYGNQILINLGRRSGVKVGDRFRLAVQNPLQDRINIARITAVDTSIQIDIDQVSENNARAHLSPQDAMRNIQINDLIIK
ncbi:flagella assembly protein FlgT middle domain-containing protein [uncultured Shewanella sp.]|uniref:flagella assembly protein FlgT middle domain-containing protein n=1 Tax=uncultured Shewanella sp. TaxID=173975 RepID=UPI0026025B75|nr:flagella assembly protein FlgT middle domain-containing protein [uncultured Shewanella sp.]